MSDAHATLPSLLRPPIAILGVPFDNVTAAEAIERIESMVLSGQPHYLATANVDFLVQALHDVELRRILFEANLVLCDGTPLVWASRLLGNPLPERVAGSDIVPLLIRVAADKGYRLFFLGASPSASREAVARLQAQHPNLVIAGHYSPPFNKLLEMDHDEIRRRILAAKPDVLFVSFGCPKQEKWIAMHHRSLGVPVAVGVGATIDFLAGHVRRAPIWMQRSGTEWIYRLVQEPRRLFRRYVKDLWFFGWGILAQFWNLQFRYGLTKRRRPKDNAPMAEEAPYSSTILLSQTLQCQSVKLPEHWDLAATVDDPLLVDRVLADGRHCLLDMADVKWIDSTGLGLLIRLQKRLHAAGRQLILLAPGQTVCRALSLLQVDEFFASAATQAAARDLLEARTRERSAVLTVRGDLDAGRLFWTGEVTAANAQEVWAETQSRILASKPVQGCVIDLSNLRFVDSTGLGLMVRARKLAGQQGIRVAFTNLRPAVRNVVQISRLEEFLLEKPGTSTLKANPGSTVIST